MGVFFTTRETVKAAVDVKDSARANAQIDRLIDDASRSIEKLCHRLFHPRVATLRLDWPDPNNSPSPWRVWLNGSQEIYSLTSATSGGSTVDTANLLLYPSEGPPYTELQIDTSAAVGFDTGATPQRSLVLSALLAYSLDETPVGTIAEDLDASETAVDVAASHLIGVGAVLRCDSERMIVTEKVALDTGIDVAAPGMTDQMNVRAVSLSTATGAPQPGEMIIIDGERMLVVDLIGTTAYVNRAYDGTPIAAHTAGTGIFAYRTLTVERGALGTTAATHTSGATLQRWKPDAPLEGLAVAKTLAGVAQENSAYARVIGAGEGQREARGAGLKDKVQEVYDNYARKARIGAV